MGVEIDDSQKRLTVAQAQYAASSTIYGSNDPVEILDALIAFGGRPFAEAHMGLFDSETEILHIIVIRDESGVKPTSFGRGLEEYPAYETLSAVEELYIADVLTDPFLTDQERELLQSRNISSMLVIPLIVGQRFTGLIEFSNPNR